MMQTLLVAGGGAVGAVLRWKMSGLILHHTLAWKLPLGTLAVNVAGCVIAGLLTGLVTRAEWFSAETRLLLFTGLLGGFTTFSAFGLETVYLLRDSQYWIAGGYVALSVVGGIGGFWLAMAAVMLWPAAT